MHRLFFFNENTEAEEEENASGIKFPGSENCILSQAFNIHKLLWTLVCHHSQVFSAGK